MNSSPTPGTRTRSRAECVLALAAALFATGAQAHGDAHEILPAEPGLRVSAAAALTHLQADERLPSARMAGFLLQGDEGLDRRGSGLEHGVIGLGARLDPRWSGYAALARHGGDPEHLEAAWIRAGDAARQATLGRMRPTMGAELGNAGHLDAFALMPLARQLSVGGDRIADGAELGWRGSGEARWSADLGLWSGDRFPGASGRVSPSLHLGLARGAWTLDGWASWWAPRERGARIQSAAGHSHSEPDCAIDRSKLVCFSGDSRVLAASLVWDGRDSPRGWPLRLSAAGWLRQESGAIESINGVADYSGRHRSGWLQAQWDFARDWQVGARAERATASVSLSGAGAALLARDAGLDAYAPISRQTLLLSRAAADAGRVSAELGQERQNGRSVRFALLRWRFAWSN